MCTQKEQAYELLKTWKGENYVFGLNVMQQLGNLVRRFGNKALVVSSGRHSQEMIQIGLDSMAQAGIRMVTDACVPGAKPNTPREDVYRLESSTISRIVWSLSAVAPPLMPARPPLCWPHTAGRSPQRLTTISEPA